MLPANPPAGGASAGIDTSLSLAILALSLKRIGLTLVMIGVTMILLSFDYLTAALAIAAGAVTFQFFNLPLDVNMRRSVLPPPNTAAARARDPDCCGCGQPRHIRPLLIALLVFACVGLVWTAVLAGIFIVYVGGPAASWMALGAIGDAAIIATSGVGISRMVEWETRFREFALAQAGPGGLVSYGVPGGGSTPLPAGHIFVVTGGPGRAAEFPGQYSSASVYPAGGGPLPQQPYVGYGGPVQHGWGQHPQLLLQQQQQQQQQQSSSAQQPVPHPSIAQQPVGSPAVEGAPHVQPTPEAYISAKMR